VNEETFPDEIVPVVLTREERALLIADDDFGVAENNSIQMS